MVLSRDEFPAKVKAELKEALAYFIERQKLVAQAIPFLKTKKLRSRRTQRAATVLNVKAIVAFYSVGNKKSLASERLLVAHHRIEDGEEFPHAGSQGHFLEFASCQ